MDSISKNPAKVKWQEKKRESLRVAQRLKKHKSLYGRACRMEACGDLTYMMYCEHCGHTHMISGAMCRDRLCPLCGWRLSVARFSQMLTVLSSLAAEFNEYDIHCSFMTLTVKNVPLWKLRDTLHSFSQAWTKMSKTKAIQDLYGWARTYEITYNKERNDYHPHMHLLLFWRGLPDTTARFNQKIVNHWIKSLGLNYVPIWQHENAYSKIEDKDIQALQSVISWRSDSLHAAEAAAIEASKYAFKNTLLTDIPENDLPKLAQAIHKIRFVAYGGAIKDRRALLALDDESMDDEGGTKTCPICGRDMLTAVLEWSGGEDGDYKAQGGFRRV